MNNNIKDYIEKNINLIDAKEWDKFFAHCPVGTGYYLYEADVDFLSQISTINKRMFAGSEISEMEIPANVTSLEEFSFYGCASLRSVKIRNNVRSIGERAFSECTSLERISIPDSVEIIGDSTFKYCTSLTTAIIGKSVKSIGEYAFYECTNLTNVKISDSVTSIGKYAFFYCDSLTNIEIPSSVTSIGDRAFSGSSRKLQITYFGTMEQWRKLSSKAMYGITYTCKCIDGVVKQ